MIYFLPKIVMLNKHKILSTKSNYLTWLEPTGKIHIVKENRIPKHDVRNKQWKWFLL